MTRTRRRHTPEQIIRKLDDGPEFVAHAVADWCRFAGAESVFVDPGSP